MNKSQMYYRYGRELSQVELDHERELQRKFTDWFNGLSPRRPIDAVYMWNPEPTLDWDDEIELAYEFIRRSQGRVYVGKWGEFFLIDDSGKKRRWVDSERDLRDWATHVAGTHVHAGGSSLFKGCLRVLLYTTRTGYWPQVDVMPTGLRELLYTATSPNECI